MSRIALAIVLMLTLQLACDRSTRLPYQNTDRTFETRAGDLVSRMTLEEKTGQLTHDARPVERLGIPPYNWWNECLHGVARAGKATVFPQAIGMAATFDRDLMYRMAGITSTEARAKYNEFLSRNKRGIYQGLTFWSPNINIFRDPRWGRGHETYGEDPYLTGEMAVRFIRGLQGDHPRYMKAVATSKHYIVHSGPEPGRHEFDAVIDEADFRETYLPAFRKSVLEGEVHSVMCAYNRYLGEPCCGSTSLLQGVLRGELGFQGYVVSDCGAIRDFHTGHDVVQTAGQAAALGVRAGTDLNCGNQYQALDRAVKQGLISEEEIDVSVKRLMLARMKLGMFDPPEMVPWSGIGPEVVASRSHREAALEMARKSIVLLKNEAGALPLSRRLEKVAVIGPNAHNTDVQNGNYNGTPVSPVSILEGIRMKLGEESEVRYALGSPHHDGLPYLETVPAEVLFTDREGAHRGLEVKFYSNLEARGEPVAARRDSLLDVRWWDGNPPVEDLNEDGYAVEWSGFLVPRKDGLHAIGVEGKFVSLLFDSDTLIAHRVIHHPGKPFRMVELRAGRAYPFRVILQDRHGDAVCALHWEEPHRPLLYEAVRTAAWSDHVVLVMGLSARLEGEEMGWLDLEGFSGGDRTSLDLPRIQQQLIGRLARMGKPVTLVLMTGSAVSITRESELVPGILQAWYGGGTAGMAVADVLFGDHNPSGRLPVTFYRSVDDLPDFSDYSMKGRTYRYFDGEVLYPFGHGLSYTEFTYGNLILEKDEIQAGDSLTVSVDVSNTGQLGGEEVVQLYVKDSVPGMVRPLRSLRGFEKVYLSPGQTRVVTMTLGPGELEVYDPLTGTYTVFPGNYGIMVGPSSDPKKLLVENLTVR